MSAAEGGSGVVLGGAFQGRHGDGWIAEPDPPAATTNATTSVQRTPTRRWRCGEPATPSSNPAA